MGNVVKSVRHALAHAVWIAIRHRELSTIKGIKKYFGLDVWASWFESALIIISKTGPGPRTVVPFSTPCHPATHGCPIFVLALDTAGSGEDPTTWRALVSARRPQLKLCNVNEVPRVCWGGTFSKSSAPFPTCPHHVADVDWKFLRGKETTHGKNAHGCSFFCLGRAKLFLC